jgi:hypothetical protein
LRKPLGVREQVAKHPFQVRQNIVVPVADDSHTLLGEPLRSTIVGLLTLFGMLSAVHFDGQAETRTIKINREWSDRVLPSE